MVLNLRLYRIVVSTTRLLCYLLRCYIRVEREIPDPLLLPVLKVLFRRFWTYILREHLTLIQIYFRRWLLRIRCCPVYPGLGGVSAAMASVVVIVFFKAIECRCLRHFHIHRLFWILRHHWLSVKCIEFPLIRFLVHFEGRGDSSLWSDHVLTMRETNILIGRIRPTSVIGYFRVQGPPLLRTSRKYFLRRPFMHRRMGFPACRTLTQVPVLWRWHS